MDEHADFTTVNWRISYKTSSLRPDGKPVDILHDFYIPVLKYAVRYDRVAGYFRSSSLAAASQGFSAFVDHGGKARFIVGADLDPTDVAAMEPFSPLGLMKSNTCGVCPTQNLLHIGLK